MKTFDQKSRRKIALLVIITMVVSVVFGYLIEAENIMSISLNWLGGIGSAYILGDSYRKSEAQ